MMKVVELKKDIYWVGAIDWNVRSFHGYTTNRGSTYGAYLIMDEKITLIDTVKKPFAKELLARISEIVDPAKIDYLISNHVEMDHSGAIPEVMEVAKNATIITTDKAGLMGLQKHYGVDFKFEAVKTSDVLNIGKRNLTFVATPMLHWPDNMVTYCPEEKILFSNDAFGQHFASSAHFDDMVDIEQVYQEAKKYYANILMPFGANIKKALEIVKTLELDMIAPSHGVIWRKNVSTILDMYDKFSDAPDPDKAVVVFDSMWESTRIMAEAVTETFAKAGKTVFLYDLKSNHISEIITEVLTAKYIAVGSPTLNNNMLPTVAGFLSYLNGLTPKDKVGIAFGSYGWGPKGVMQVQDALAACGYTMSLPALKCIYVPDDAFLDKMCEDVASVIR